MKKIFKKSTILMISVYQKTLSPDTGILKRIGSELKEFFVVTLGKKIILIH